MASANWLKATTQKAGAMKKHLGQKERETGNHSNTDIDTSLSKLNYAIGCSDYLEALERMKSRTKEVDAVQPPKRVRKDRVTCCFIELPCPDALTQQGRSDEFFRLAYQVMQDFFGGSNVHGGFVHKDERHKYIDKNGKQRMSLEHMHTLVSAYTESKGINGKAFETRGRLKAFNKALDDMCIREFGISLNTGETPQRKSVETLKQESEARQELGTLQRHVEALQRATAKSRDDFLEADERATEAKIKASEAKKQAEASEKRIKSAEQKLEEVNAQTKAANEQLKKVIDMKAKAAKVPSLNPFAKTVSVHENTWHGIREIGNEAYNNMEKANQTLQEAVSKEQAIAPLYREANNDRVIASQELKRAKELREKQEQLIEQKAEELAETRVLQAMRGVATNRSQRLEAFCQGLKFADGTTALEEFEKQEQERERQALERTRKRKRGFER